MASWNLNDSRQIAYFDANGNKHSAKEVWYKGQYNKYKVWPGSIYLTNVKIVDNKSHEEYDYEIDNNGNTKYISSNGNEYSGLSPNTSYTIKGTIVVYRLKNEQNVEVASYDDCYLWALTSKDWNGGTGSHSPIWSVSNSTDTKPNPILPEGDPQKYWQYNLYQCTPDFAKYKDGSAVAGNDDDVWMSSHLGFITKWPGDSEDGGFTVVGRLGEIDYGIRLRRTPISRQIDCNCNYPMLGYNNTGIYDCVYKTTWGSTNPGSITKKDGFTIINNNSDILNISHDNNGKLTVKCIKPVAGYQNYTFTIKAEDYGKELSLDKTVTVVGPSYRLQAAYGPNSINPDGGIMTISSDKTVVVYRAVSSDDIANENYEKLTNFSLSTSDNSIVGVSNAMLKPKKSGTATITVTDGDLGTTFTFTCKVDIVNTDTYMDVTVDGVNKVSKVKVTSSGYTVYVSSKCSMINIGLFTTSASPGTSKTVYYEFNGNGGYTNMSLTGTAPYITINTLNGSNPYVFVCKLYTDSSKSNYIGEFTIDYL